LVGHFDTEKRWYRREMNAYLCTYRRIALGPSSRRLKRTSVAAKRDPLLRAFLEGYEDSYYDWGDDPSFFAAERRLGDACKASWGVCRRDVRNALGERDLVVFFCGREDKNKRVWRYYFVGFGTVRVLVERKALWRDPAYAPYRKFYNVLARLDGRRLVQSETFHHFHSDWRLRAKAPYVLFDPARSAFNLRFPHCVATWEDGATVPETWKADARTKEIENLLFIERGINRRLRTSASGYGHAKLNLVRDGHTVRPGRTPTELARALRQFV
jgi:hypothetical protein